MSRLLRRILPGVRSGAGHAAASSRFASSQAASSRSLYTSRFVPAAYQASATAAAAPIAMSRLLPRHLLPGVRSGASHLFASAATSRSPSSWAAASRTLSTSRLAPPAYHTSATATAAAAGAQSEGAAAAAAESTPATGDQPSPMPSPAARGRWAEGPLKLGALAAVAGAIGGVGYASYVRRPAYWLNEVAEKTREFRKKPALLISEDASTFEKYKAMVYSTAIKVPAIELYMDIRGTIEDHVEGFTEPTSDKLLPDLLPQDQHGFTLFLDLNESLVNSDWQASCGIGTFRNLFYGAVVHPGIINGKSVGLKRMYSSNSSKKWVNSTKATTMDVSRWIYRHLSFALPQLCRLIYQWLKNALLEIIGVAVVGYMLIYLWEKLKFVLWGDANVEEDSAGGPDVDEKSQMLKAGRVVSVFYELGWRILKAIRVATTELREVKQQLKELLDVDTTRLVMIKLILAELKKINESSRNTDKTLSSEVKRLEDMISGRKEASVPGVEVEKQD